MHVHIHTSTGNGKARRSANGRPATASTATATTFKLKVVSMRGLDRMVTVAPTNTVADLRTRVSQAFGIPASDFKLMIRAKEYDREHDARTLQNIGITARDIVIIAQRVHGGGRNLWQARSAQEEVVVQLRYIHQLHNVVAVAPDDDECRQLNLLMRGEKGTPLAGGVFQIEIMIPSDFPRSAPDVRFRTPMFHPNIFSDGSLCWNDQGKGDRYFLDAIICAINTLLKDPNPHSPANSEAAKLYLHHRAEYNRRVKSLTVAHALH